jgi:predicted membrane channel-forming protein YqfA (hemolysin III family)
MLLKCERENTFVPVVDLGYWVHGGFLYIGGACIYMLRIPERFFPLKFDIFVSEIYNFSGLIAPDLPSLHCDCCCDALLRSDIEFPQQTDHALRK